MRKYEVMLAIRGSLIESEAKAVYDKFVKKLSEAKAKVTFEEAWGKINTAYKIAHETTAHYYVVNIEIDGAEIQSLELYMQLDNDIIRSLVTKIEDTHYTPVSKEMYEAGMEAFYADRQERQKKAMPKTRATTAKQLEEEMKGKPKKGSETKEDKKEDKKIDKVIGDLSL